MMNMTSTAKPVSLLIAALGGEGGGVLVDWIVEAARSQDYPVQATSLPGVSQRTGATTYYVELAPEAQAPGQPRRMLSLAPVPGEVDLLVASELAEGARALQAGFITPDRTILLASTHRVYLNTEKIAMGDGRLDVGKLRDALMANAKTAILFDADKMANEAGTIVNAVLLGAISASGVLNIPEIAFRAAIECAGKAVGANLAGFTAGLEAGQSETEATTPAPFEDQAANEFPADARQVIGEGVKRLLDYQGQAYVKLYLDRLAPFAGGDGDLCREVACHLALRMSYEDVIRVAQAKTRPGRLRRIEGETGAGPKDHLEVTEFLKPGIAEISDLLPPALARALLGWAERTGRLENLYFPMQLRSTSISGFLKLRLLTGLRWWRPRSYRYGQAQSNIESWLELVGDAADQAPALGLEVARLAGLIKGYGQTHRRGLRNYLAITEGLVRPLLQSGAGGSRAAEQIAEAGRAALADTEGNSLEKLLAGQEKELLAAAQ